jgi:hypothetical protein
MANTIGTSTLSEVWRIKYVKSTLELALRTALVAEKICQVDRSDSKYIANPYLTGATAAVAAMAGTYSVSTATTTDDTLEVTDQVTYGVHLYEFESTLSRADLFTSFVEDMKNAVAVKVDQFVLNKVLDQATGSYTTPTGGFTTAGNINQIIANLVSKVSGYADVAKGLFLVIENTDLPGFIQAGMSNGFSFADSALNNGFGGHYGGVDVYVVRASTFVTATIGTLTATNSGHRLFGVKSVAHYAAPRGIQYEEKMVTGKTGREIACWANIGAKVWTPKSDLLVDITLS